MNEWLKGWLASEAATHDKIEVKRIYIDLNEGNLYDGVIFSQIMYWHGTNRENGKPRMSIERNGELWLAKSYSDWFAECRIIESTARACINRIAKRGLIVKKLWKFNGAPTIHIRIDWDNLEDQLKLICDDISNGFDSKYQIGIDTSYQNDTIADHKSLTDTTADTTAKELSAPKSAVKKSRSKKPTTPKEILNPMADAVMAQFGWKWETASKNEKSKARGAAKELCLIGRTPDEVPLFYAECRKRGWKDFSPNALLNVVSDVAKKSATKIIPLTLTTDADYPDTADYVNLAGVSNVG